jgi:hypothetical protein
MKRLALALLFACGLAACGGEDNTLKGSMSQVYSLKFDRVQILRVGVVGREEVSVEYLRMSGEQIAAYVAKLTVKVGDLANLAGNEISLTEKVSNGLPRGTISRIEGTETSYDMKMGNVEFDQEPLAGTNLSGRFFTTILTEEGDRTLNGTFKADVEAR